MAENEAKRETGRHKRHGHEWKGGHGHRIHLLLAVVALVAALVAGIAIGNGGLVTQGEQHVDSTTIKNSFADVAELATQEYDFSNVGKFSQDDMKILDLSIPFTGRSFLVTYSGSVKAGIEDISKASVDVDDGARTVTITLPQVTVLDSHIDSDSVETYDQTLNPINQISVDDVTSFLSSEEEARKEDAVNGGILDRARERAEGLITSNVRALLSGTSQKDYDIKISWQEADADASSDASTGDNTNQNASSTGNDATDSSDTNNSSAAGEP